MKGAGLYVVALAVLILVVAWLVAPSLCAQRCAPARVAVSAPVYCACAGHP